MRIIAETDEKFCHQLFARQQTQKHSKFHIHVSAQWRYHTCNIITQAGKQTDVCQT